MRRNGFRRREVDHDCYLKKFDSTYIILVLNVDDELIVSSDMKMINKLRRQLTREFKAMNLGAANLEKALGIVNHTSECANVFSIERLKQGKTSTIVP